MRRRTFPEPLRVGRRPVAWRTSDILRWQNNLPRGPARPPTNPEADRTCGPTIAALFEEYTKIAQQARSWPEQRRIFEKEVVPVWGERLVSEIQKRDIRELVLAKATTAPIMANRLLDRLSRLFSFAVELDWISVNPAHGLPPPTRERSRDRVLSRDELRELWPALQDGQPLTDVLLMMLLTAQRRGEISRMRWQDVDIHRGWWTIPAELSKNADPHPVPLIAEARALLTNGVGLASGTKFMCSPP
jgi:integrase